MHGYIHVNKTFYINILFLLCQNMRLILHRGQNCLTERADMCIHTYIHAWIYSCELKYSILTYPLYCARNIRLTLHRGQGGFTERTRYICIYIHKSIHTYMDIFVYIKTFYTDNISFVLCQNMRLILHRG
jgi:hypothetical protein